MQEQNHIPVVMDKIPERQFRAAERHSAANNDTTDSAVAFIHIEIETKRRCCRQISFDNNGILFALDNSAQTGGSQIIPPVRSGQPMMSEPADRPRSVPIRREPSVTRTDQSTDPNQRRSGSGSALPPHTRRVQSPEDQPEYRPRLPPLESEQDSSWLQHSSFPEPALTNE